MKNSIIQQLKSVTTLHADFRSGGANDRSPLARAVTITAPVQIKSGIGATFQGAGRIAYADHASGRNTTGSIVVLTNPAVQNTGYLFAAGVGAAYRISFYHNPSGPTVGMYNGTTAVTTNPNINNCLCVSCDYSNGVTGKAYVNGIFHSNFSGALAVTAQDSPITIGNNNGGSSVSNSTIAAIMEFSRVLTATEHAQVYAELSKMKWPTKPLTLASRKEADNNLLADGDMEAATTAAWTSGGINPTLSKVAGSRTGGAGTKVLRVENAGAGDAWASANQAVCTVGKRYNIKGWARGDGAKQCGVGTDTAFSNIWAGTASNTWQYFNVNFTFPAGSSVIRLEKLTAGIGYSEFDDVVITRIPAKVDTIVHLEGSPISVAARGGAIGQYLENTPFQFGDTTGRYSVSTDTIFGKPNSKVISCSTAGLLYIPSTQAYGTWEFDLYKGNTSSNTMVEFINNGITNIDAAATRGYVVQLSATERGIVYRMNGSSAVSNVTVSDVNYIAMSTWYKIRVTRSATGVFTTYILLSTGWVLLPAVGGGANPSTADNTYTTSTHFVIDLDATDKISNIIFKPLA
jgi:hypothetical protein